MPRIHEYSADATPEGVPNSRRLTEGDAVSGDGLIALGKGTATFGAALKEKETQDDVTNVRVGMAQARAKWDVAFRDASMGSEPGDPKFAENFTQQVRDDLDKQRSMAQTAHGERTFDLLAADLNEHFTEKAGLFQIQSAGVKAKLDWDIAQRAYATSVVTDPTSYGSVLKQAISEIQDPQGQYGRIDGNTRTALETKARDTLAQAYVNGLIDNGAPELALKQLMDGRLDDQLEPKDKQRLVHAANAGITAKRVGAEHADALARKAEKDRIDKINTDLNDRFMSKTLTWPDVRAAGLPANGEGSQDHWMTRLKQQAKDLAEAPARTSATVFNDLRARIDLPAGDPQKLQDRDEVWKYYGKGLSEADASRLERRVIDARTESGQRYSQAEAEFIKNIRPQLDKSTFVSTDAGGGERVQAFTVHLREKADALRKDKKDVYSLFNPNSPDYAGKDIPQFQTGAQRTQAGLTDKLNTTLAPKPRKSLDEIFKGKP